MRELWVKVDPALPQNEKKILVEKTASLTSAFIVEPQDIELAKESGAKTIVSPTEKGDITIVKNLKEVAKVRPNRKRTCILVTIKSHRDEAKIVAAAEALVDYVVVECPDWKVIPLENLIAKVHGKTKLLAVASDMHEAKTALQTLELGVDGIVADKSNVDEILKINDVIKETKTRTVEVESAEKITLLPAKVTEVRTLSSGARVCIDMCDLMKEGEGILVGCQSNGLFLVEAEVHETPFVAPRPFRVNAGSISLYVLAPGGKTRYLSELKAGDEVLIIDRNGKPRTTNIGRVKIEWRPLLMIEAECQGKTVKTILQNAETIRVVTEEASKSVKDLKTGDMVLVRFEEGGRHFGTLVKEEKVIER
jgi:3-dehydroquinate synthase II